MVCIEVVINLPLPPLAVTPTTLPISVKLTEAEISLLVIGLLAFIIGVCVGASIGMVLFLRADNKFGENHEQYLYC